MTTTDALATESGTKEEITTGEGRRHLIFFPVQAAASRRIILENDWSLGWSPWT